MTGIFGRSQNFPFSVDGTMSQKLHEEANILAVRDIQIRLANEYLKHAKENKIKSILELIQKKDNVQKKLSNLTRPSVLIMFFTFNSDKIAICTDDDKNCRHQKKSRFIGQAVNGFGTN